MMIPEADKMAKAIRVVCQKLLSVQVLDNESYSALERLQYQLRQFRHESEWRYDVDRVEGFKFRRLKNHRNEVYMPVVSVAGIHVAPEENDLPPFRQLDVSLELRYDHVTGGTARWHFDQANYHRGVAQPGPRFHLQYGGHVNQDRALDEPLSLPRWSHPPMDLVLLLEAVAANFFPDEWAELREDRTWCEQIQVSQRLYLTHYSQTLANCVGVSQGTFLKNVWADCWCA